MLRVVASKGYKMLFSLYVHYFYFHFQWIQGRLCRCTVCIYMWSLLTGSSTRCTCCSLKQRATANSQLIYVRVAHRRTKFLDQHHFGNLLSDNNIQVFQVLPGSCARAWHECRPRALRVPNANHHHTHTHRLHIGVAYYLIIIKYSYINMRVHMFTGLEELAYVPCIMGMFSII